MELSGRLIVNTSRPMRTAAPAIHPISSWPDLIADANREERCNIVVAALQTGRALGAIWIGRLGVGWIDLHFRTFRC